MRDSRPCWITSRDVATYFPVIRHLGRLGLVDYKGGPGTWSGTITDEGVRALAREHKRERESQMRSKAS